MIYMAAYEPGDSLYNRKREHSLGRELLDFGLKREYGRTWEVRDGSGTKPYLLGAPGISFNISHTRGLAVCAISRRAVGVDVELVRPFKESLLRRVCSEEERCFVLTGRGLSAESVAESKTPVGTPSGAAGTAQERFFRLWTLKESFVKAVGQGLKFPLKDITFSCEGGVPGTGGCSGHIKGSIPGWHFYQSMVYESYIISVCEADEEGESV